MSLFSKTGLFGKIWGGIKTVGIAIGHLFSGIFTDVETKFLPYAIIITEDINNAVNNQSVDDLITAISPELAGIPTKLLDIAKQWGPKVLSTMLGLEALKSGATLEEGQAWAQSVITAYAGKTFAEKSEIWNKLATQLIVLWNEGKAENASWFQWSSLAQQAFEQVKAAIAAAKADPSLNDEDTTP